MTAEPRPILRCVDRVEDAPAATAVHRHSPAHGVAARQADHIRPPTLAMEAIASIEERRALLTSAAVLMEEALRLLDQSGCAIVGVWLSHAAECLEQRLRSLD